MVQTSQAVRTLDQSSGQTVATRKLSFIQTLKNIIAKDGIQLVGYLVILMRAYPRILGRFGVVSALHWF